MYLRLSLNGPILRAILAAVTACGIACGSSSRSPTAPLPPSPPPPAPPVSENREPSVTVTFTSAKSCMPHGSFSCTLDVAAVSSDPDGDALTYTWSGCATGTAATAVCTIKDPGPVAATVAVNDGHGHSVSASASGEGEPEPNRPPSVTLIFPAGTECAPSPRSPCTLDVLAQASDPDGDALRYTWSGCASGSSERTQCTVTALGPVTATVTVEDLHNHVVRTSTTGAGINHPPDISVGYVVIPAGGSSEIDMLGDVMDPDEGFLCGRQYCGGISTSGACGSGALVCTCLAGVEVYIVRTATAGTCSVTFELKDSWGAAGRPTITIDVATLKILRHTSATAVASQAPRAGRH